MMFNSYKPTLGRIVCTPGGFDPIHSGHISCLQESKKLGDCLVVVVNGDNFLKIKKGKPFMNLLERSKIVSSIKGVDYVIPFETYNDMTVTRDLERIKPNTFTKGGDRNSYKTIPEHEICEKLQIELLTNIGTKKDKKFSSTEKMV